MADAVVIGGNGFIGSHLVDALSSAGYGVTAFDRFSGNPTYVSERVRIVRGDFLNRADLASAVEGQHTVFHFLSTTSPMTSEKDPLIDIRTNVEQTVALLEECVRAGVQEFFFASTGGAIYGHQATGEYSETAPTLPVSPYAIGKLSIENYLRYFEVVHGLKSTALRISNPYGTRQSQNRSQGLIPIALRQILAGERVVRFGDGSMVRDYLYVEDLTRMITTMVGRDRSHAVYNLGSGRGYSVTMVLESLKRVTGVDFAIEQVSVPPTFVDRVVLDTSRFRDEFGSLELTELDEGIDRTLSELRSRRNE